jgi:hypothetical protein
VKSTKTQAAPARGSMTVVDTFRGTWIVFDSRNRLFTATLVNVWPEPESPYDRRFPHHGRRGGWVGSIRAAYTLARKFDDAIATNTPVLAVVDLHTEYGAACRFEVAKIQVVEGKVMVLPQGGQPGHENRNRHRRDPHLATCDAKTLRRLVAKVTSTADTHDKATAALKAVTGKRSDLLLGGES